MKLPFAPTSTLIFAIMFFAGLSSLAQTAHPANIQEISSPSADLGSAIATACKSAGPNGQIRVNVTRGTLSTSPFAACGASTVIEFGPGEFTFTGAAASNTIAVNGLKILGAGKGATIFILDSPISNFFTVNGKYFELGKMHIRPKAGVTRTAGHIIVAHNALGFVHDLVLIDPWNGFYMEGPTTGGWSFDNLSVYTSGGNWNYLLKTYSSSGTVTSFNLHNVIGDLAHGHEFGPLMLFDSRTDTVALSDINIVGAGGQPMVRCQDSDNAGKGQWPRWIHLTNAYFEAANSTVIELENSRDFSFQNSYASGANIGIAVGPGSFDTKIIGNVFPNLNEQAITIAAGSRNTIIQGNTFSSTGTAGKGVPIIDVAANASDFIISGNQASSFTPPADRPDYGVRIAPGNSTRFFVVNNSFQYINLKAVQNGAAAGGIYTVSGNIP